MIHSHEHGVVAPFELDDEADFGGEEVGARSWDDAF